MTQAEASKIVELTKKIRVLEQYILRSVDIEMTVGWQTIKEKDYPDLFKHVLKSVIKKDQEELEVLKKELADL